MFSRQDYCGGGDESESTFRLLDAEQDARFAEQVRKITEEIRYANVGCGDAAMTTVPEELAKRYEISPMVRMTMKSGEVRFKGGPLKIDRHDHYIHKERDMTDFAKDWAAGRACHIPQYMYEEVPVPVLRKKPQSASRKACHSLFEYIYASGRELTLVNPSFGAMTELLMFGGYVLFTDTMDRDWKVNLRDFIANSQGKIQEVHSVVGTAFLGSNTPDVKFGSEWFYLVPNPVAVQDEGHFSLTERDDAVTMQVVKEGRSTFSELRYSDPYYVYGPQTMGLYAQTYSYVLVSNFSFPLPGAEVEFPGYSMTPKFLDDYPDFKIENVSSMDSHGNESDIVSWNWSRSGHQVYDVKGPGTYISRRARIKLPVGFYWAPLRPVGRYSCCRFSQSPRYSSDVAVVQVQDIKYVVYGQVEPVSWVRSASLLCSTPHPFVRADGTVLPSTPVTLVTGQTAYINPVGSSKGEPFITISSGNLRARAIPVEEVHRDCVAYYRDPRGSVPVAGLPAGGFETLQSFYVDGKRYVLHDATLPREVTLFGDKSNLTKYVVQTLHDSQFWTKMPGGLSVDAVLSCIKPVTLVDKVIDFMQHYSVNSFSEQGVTVRMVAEKLGISSHAAFSVMRASPSVLRWKDGLSVFQQEFIMRSNIHAFVRGKVDNVSKDPPISDGRSFVGLYEQILLAKKVTLYFKEYDKDFIRVLQENKRAVHLAITPGLDKVYRVIVISLIY